ncbi:MAG TPA: SgcJ/EcaC family oxidoreductase [Burkholderiaceae bacterium]|nr:SgcJ/EcaC family oxidoreductase [Burkholderiaceae bacterium]
MLRLPTSLAFLALTLFGCAGMPGADQGPQSAMEQFRAAFNKQDASGVASVFKDDAKLLPPGKPMMTGTEAIRAYWQGAFSAGVSHIDKTPIDVAVSGDLAVETSSYVVTFKDQRIIGKDTLVWRRGKDNLWRIASDIWNNDN